MARRDFDASTGAATGVFYYFSDHLKTASVVTDSAGNITAESDYYPWGGELQFVNNDSNHYKFTGKERDESGLDYFGARYYSNGLGRFITPDWAAKATAVPYAEFADPQSLNLYSYVRNVPTVKPDPDGHEIPVDPNDINTERVATFLKDFANAAVSTYQDANNYLNHLYYQANSCGCGNSGTYDVGNREPESDSKNSNNSFRQSNEQGRDAQGKFTSKQPGQTSPGSAAEKEGLDSVGAVKNTEKLNGTVRDGTIVETGQHVEVKSGETVGNTKQLRDMGQAAMDKTEERLKVVTTNPNVKVTKPAQRNPNLEFEPVKKKE